MPWWSRVGSRRSSKGAATGVEVKRSLIQRVNRVMREALCGSARAEQLPGASVSTLGTTASLSLSLTDPAT
jgi:hypothetical protein